MSATLYAPASPQRPDLALLAAVHESAVGPSPTWCDVRDLVAIGGEADMTRTSNDFLLMTLSRRVTRAGES